MNGGQLDGAMLKVELSDLPIRPLRVSRSPALCIHNGLGGDRRGKVDARSYSRSRSQSPSRSWSQSRFPGIAEGTILSRLRILYVPVTHEQRLILVPALHILV